MGTLLRDALDQLRFLGFGVGCLAGDQLVGELAGGVVGVFVGLLEPLRHRVETLQGVAGHRVGKLERRLLFGLVGFEVALCGVVGGLLLCGVALVVNRLQLCGGVLVVGDSRLLERCGVQPKDFVGCDLLAQVRIASSSSSGGLLPLRLPLLAYRFGERVGRLDFCVDLVDLRPRFLNALFVELKVLRVRSCVLPVDLRLPFGRCGDRFSRRLFGLVRLDRFIDLADVLINPTVDCGKILFCFLAGFDQLRARARKLGSIPSGFCGGFCGGLLRLERCDQLLFGINGTQIRCRLATGCDFVGVVNLLDDRLAILVALLGFGLSFFGDFVLLLDRLHVLVEDVVGSGQRRDGDSNGAQNCGHRGHRDTRRATRRREALPCAGEPCDGARGAPRLR